MQAFIMSLILTCSNYLTQKSCHIDIIVMGLYTSSDKLRSLLRNSIRIAQVTGNFFVVICLCIRIPQ